MPGPLDGRVVEAEIEHFLDNFKKLYSERDEDWTPTVQNQSDQGDNEKIKNSVSFTSSGGRSSAAGSTVFMCSASTKSETRSSKSSSLCSTSSLTSTGSIGPKEYVRVGQAVSDLDELLGSSASSGRKTSRSSSRSQMSPSKENHYVMGETGCTLTVLDVADALQGRYAYVSGGRTRNGQPLITFPDNPGLPEVSDEVYRNVVTYLTSIPTLQEVDLGFALIVDRRQCGWGAVKTMLLRISGFFPGLVQEVYVLRPSGFFQRALSDMGYKFVKDDFKFKVLMCSSLEELWEYIDVDQLTDDQGGTIQYDHQEWIQHRAAIEKFSANTSHIGETLRDLCQRLQETEFPNNVAATEILISDHEAEMREVKEDLMNTIKHGEILLNCFKSIRGADGEEHVLPSSQLPSNKLAHVTAVERLLVQLEETQQNFEEFWSHHESRLHQCLELRKFEEEFKQLQFSADKDLEMLQTMTDPGDSLQRVETLLRELSDFEEVSKEDFTKADQLRAQGEKLIEEDHYAVDCIRPKCIELQRMCEQYKELVRRRYEVLQKSRDLQDRIDKANKWCTRGLDLLTAQQLEPSNTTEGTEQALADIEAFQKTASELKLNNPKEFRSLFDSMITAETKTSAAILESLDTSVVEEVEMVVQQVLQRIEDVQNMCEKRYINLKEELALANRVVQPVVAEPVASLQNSTSQALPPSGDQDRKRRKSLSGNGIRKNSLIDRFGKGKIEIIKTDGSGSDTSGSIESDLDLHHNQNVTRLPGPVSPNSPSLLSADTLQAKQGLVMKELIDTERVYVSELQSILEGYANELESPVVEHLIPEQLLGKKEVLFGNMEEIYDFHSRVFVKDLENCQNTPAMVGKCFVDRKEEFQMYSIYCQNKPNSEALRRRVGDSNPFFKECQKKLNHRLPLGAYLLKPVQRITKYQLLLKEMLKYTQNEVGNEALQEAVDTMLSVLKYVNDIMHQIAITGYSDNLSELGRLLMQGSFSVWTAHKKDKIRDLRFKPMQRHIFLYEKGILFCKKKDDPHNAENASYLFKNSLNTARIGLTENVKGDKKKFEVWLHGRHEVYIIQAPSMVVKDIWVSEVKKVLMHQFDRIKETVKKSKETPANTIPTSRTYDNMFTSLPTSTSTENTANNNPSLPCSLDVISPTEHPSSMSRDDYTSDDGDWSSEEFEEETMPMDPCLPGDSQGIDLLTQYVALADYNSVGSGEISMREGDIVEVIKIGREGWWYVRCLATAEEGWAPASYLDSCKRRSTYSTASMSSTESGGGGIGGLRPNISRNSLKSDASSNNHLEETLV